MVRERREREEWLAVRRRYDRLAPLYDLYQGPMEWMAMRAWRRDLVARARGPLILEAGVGTGSNLPFYPADVDVVAVDVSEPMLRRAARRPSPARVHRVLMDVECLGFADHLFDTAVAAFLFCSVADPVAGLRELARVVRADGQVLLLEHVRPGTPRLGRAFDRLNPIARTLFGPNINRDTVANVRRAGLEIEEEQNLWRDVVKLLVCRPR